MYALRKPYARKWAYGFTQYADLEALEVKTLSGLETATTAFKTTVQHPTFVNQYTLRVGLSPSMPDTNFQIIISATDDERVYYTLNKTASYFEMQGRRTTNSQVEFDLGNNNSLFDILIIRNGVIVGSRSVVWVPQP